ncbi:MAG TPA: aminotransferase class IV [Hymenobacter sp.]|jgi:branched-subunit amino acid aminotransferase/4-amino-4-deoxychorismate lyase
MYVLYNGHLVAQQDFALSLPNRGLFFNDGFFETLIWAEGALRYRPYHLARMRRAAAVLGLVLPAALAEETHLEDLLRTLVAAQALQRARLRIQLWRGGGGLYTPEDSAAEFLITAQPFSPSTLPAARADFGQEVHVHFSPYSFCKGPNALLYVLAGQERQRRGLDELILLNTADNLAEAGAAAIFWIQDGQLHTPALATGCVAGVRRAHLLAVAQAHNIPCAEGFYQPADLLKAEAAFTANVATIRPLAQIAAVHLASEHHPLLLALRSWEAS